MRNFSGRGERWSNQGGSFLVCLLALVAVGSIFFAGSLRLILSSQKLIATKARLDICAVRLATSRERFLRETTVSNQYVYTTLVATYVARGLMVLNIPVVSQLAIGGQAATAHANRAAALWQDGQVALQVAREARLAPCAETPFSAQKILCVANPPIIAMAVKRDKAFFPDLRHVYRWKRKKEELGSVICTLLDNPTLYTKLKLRGSHLLDQDDYSDVYAK